jgi:hypothetical protein
MADMSGIDVFKRQCRAVRAQGRGAGQNLLALFSILFSRAVCATRCASQCL